MTLAATGREEDAGPVIQQAILSDPDNLELWEPVGYSYSFGFTVELFDRWAQSEMAALGRGDLLALVQSDWNDVAHARRRHPDHFAWRWEDAEQLKIKGMAGSIDAYRAMHLEMVEVLEEAKRLGSPQAVASLSSEVAWTYEFLGDLVQATRSQLDALEFARRADHRQLMGHAHRNLARLAVMLNELPDARGHLELADGLVHRFDAPRGWSDLAGIRGHYLAAMKQYGKAAESYAEGLRYWRATGLALSRTVETMARRARMLRLDGKPDEAASQLTEAEALAGKMPDRRGRAAVRLEQARLSLDRGRSREAIEFIKQGLDDDAATGGLLHADLLAALGRARVAAGSRRSALALGLQWVRALRAEVAANTPGLELDGFLDDKTAVAEWLLGLLWQTEGNGAAGRSLEVTAAIKALALRRRLGEDGHRTEEHIAEDLCRRLALRRRSGDEYPTFLALWSGNESSFLWIATPDQVRWWKIGGREELSRDVDRRLGLLASFPKGIDGTSAPAYSTPDPGEEPFPFLPDEALRVLSRATSLVIEAEGPLDRLPFEILLLPSGQRLIERGPISYTPLIEMNDPQPVAVAADRGSVRVHSFPLAEGNQADEAGPTGWRCPPFGQAIDRTSTARLHSSPPSLPATGEEAEALASAFGQSFQDAAVSMRLTRSDLLSSAEDAPILDLAVHACVDNDTPSNSYLVLAPSRPEEGRWEPLFAREIAGARMHFGLVILSGCRTFEGTEVAGEGTVGLARAFHEAGVPSVVSTLWDVEDLPTRLFMGDFFRRLGSGEAIDAALSDTQRAMLRSERPALRHPHFWASFRLTQIPLHSPAGYLPASVTSKKN